MLSKNLITGDLRLFIECDFTQETIKNVGKYYPTLVMNLDVVCMLFTGSMSSTSDCIVLPTIES